MTNNPNAASSSLCSKPVLAAWGIAVDMNRRPTESPPDEPRAALVGTTAVSQVPEDGDVKAPRP